MDKKIAEFVDFMGIPVMGNVPENLNWEDLKKEKDFLFTKYIDGYWYLISEVYGPGTTRVIRQL